MLVQAPVVLVPRQDVDIATDRALIEQIAGSVTQWREMAQPPSTGARLLFKITLWNTLGDQQSPLLHLQNVVLPIIEG